MNYLVYFAIICFSFISCNTYTYEGCITIFPYRFLGFSKQEILANSQKSYFRQIENVILHHTKELSLKEYIQKSLNQKQMAHYSIGRDGSIYGVDFPEKTIFEAVRNLDYSAVHILVEGNTDETLRNQLQIKSLKNLFFYLSKKYDIELSNYDINSKKGFFTHTQAKKKFGNFTDLKECGGEELIKKIFENLSATYYSEREWKNRYRNWISIYSGPRVKSSKKYRRLKNEGRGITQTPKSQLSTITQENGYLLEKYRLQYSFFGNIPATCIVLHYTASNNFMSAFNTLEKRKLSANFMIDLDGKIYQLLDAPNRMAITAAGTNQHCIQIEIVGRDTEKLIENKLQFYKVLELLDELLVKYKIVKNNHNIDSFQGIFSHSQAKKRWGYSVYLDDTDFDPGEDYMKLILEALGGKYYKESEWFGRRNKDWAIWFDSFQI